MRSLLPELTWGAIVDHLVKPVMWNQILVQPLAILYLSTEKVRRLNVHELGAVSAVPVRPLLNFLTKMTTGEASASCPIFRRRKPVSMPVHKLLHIVRRVTLAVRLEGHAAVTLTSARQLSGNLTRFRPDVSFLWWLWSSRPAGIVVSLGRGTTLRGLRVIPSQHRWGLRGLFRHWW